MSYVTIYVALITAVAGIAGATISQAFTNMRVSKRAERDRLERREAEHRQACLDLFRVVGELRTQVAFNRTHYGTDMGDRLARVREYAAAAQLNAVRVELLAQGDLRSAAERLAASARSLGKATEVNTNLELGSVTDSPVFGELDEELDDRVETFRQLAVADRMQS
jgi:hypothetical protein